MAQRLTTTQDGNTTYNPTASPPTPGTLRGAVESANELGASSSTPQIIHLGTGTYSLTIPYSSSGLQGSSGGLYVTAGNLIIEGAGDGNTIIKDNGLYDRIFDVASGAGLTLDGVTLEFGQAKNNGGAIYNAGTLNISKSDLYDNSALNGDGGAIYNTGTLNISKSTLDGNQAQGDGGGIFNSDLGVVWVSNSTLDQNGTVTGNGGGIANHGGVMRITNTTLKLNSGTSGGGIYNIETVFNHDTKIINSTLAENLATDGGGIYNEGQLFFLNSTLYANDAKFRGGGLLNNYLADLVNDTITGNRANVFNNLLNKGNGGGISDYDTSYLSNTIVADNYDGGSGTLADDIGGTVDSDSSNNLIGTGGSGGLTNGSNDNQVGVADPKLGTFGNYGGPTDTVPLLPGSPAIDAGSSAGAVQYGLTTDQRGYKRIVGSAVDIGAVEYQYDLGLSGYVKPGSTPGTVLFFYTVTNNGSDPVNGATLTFPLVQGISDLAVVQLPPDWSNTLLADNSAIIFQDNDTLNSGDQAVFEIKVTLRNTAAGTNFTTTATVGPAAADANPQNNSLTLTVTSEQEGQRFDKVQLFHFTDANPATANDFTASVGWGDGSGNISNDGSGTVSVVADPNGGFDVLGSHTYAEEGNAGTAVVVTGLDGTKYSNGNVLQTFQDLKLFHFDTRGLATVDWGDGSSNSALDGTGDVQLMADPDGGYDVLGTHTYAELGNYKVTVRAPEIFD